MLTLAVLAVAGVAALARAAGSRPVRRSPLLRRLRRSRSTCSCTCRSSIVVVFSFNDSKLNAEWVGFTLDWYRKLFANEEMLKAADQLAHHRASSRALARDRARHDGRHRDAPLPLAAAADPGADADRDARDPAGRVAADLLRLRRSARIAVAADRHRRAHDVLHRLRRDHRARAARRHGRVDLRGGARPRRHAVADVPAA